tara:strand:+ start:227 stop:709 length:483 start_codon:yes stop_codon:yes gene_type:complete
MVIDNFLSKEDFDYVQNLFMEQDFPWFFTPDISQKNVQIDNSSYMTHVLYFQDIPYTSVFHKMYPFFREKLEVKSLIRVKLNMYINCHKFREDPMHTDFPFSHRGALFSLNTCDGYTKLKDGTKVQSVANRMLLFDPSKEHCSTNTTDADRRVNINFNYF